MSIIRSLVLLPLMILYYLPAVIYRANADFLETSFRHIALLLFPIFILTASLLAVPAIFLNPKWKQRYGVVLASVAFVGSLIGIFLVFQHGLLDGQRLLRGDPVWYQRTELSGVILALALLITAGWRWPKFHNNAALFVIFLAVGLTTITLVTDKRRYSVQKASRELLRASSSKNVFVFILDTFQSDVLEAILRDKPDLVGQLDGFTFFTKTASVAPTTYLSLPAIHSGMHYSLQDSIPSYYDQGVQKNSFLTRLASVGYEASVINSIGPCPNGATCAGLGSLIGNFWSPVLRDASLLVDIAIYRFVPSFFKQRIYNEGNWIFSKNSSQKRIFTNIEFLRTLGDRLFPPTNRPVVRLIHLFITHPPIEVDSSCTPVRRRRRRWNWQNAQEQSECAVNLFSGFLQNLKEKGLYDQSLVMLVSDHGAGLTRSRQSPLMAKARSLLLVKPFQSKGALNFSTRPLHIGDIPKTICGLTQDCSYERGTFAYANEPQAAITPFFDYTWKHKYWTTKTVPIDAVWNIHGPVDDPFSWYKEIPSGQNKNLHLDFSKQDPPIFFGLGWLDHVKRGQNTLRWAETNAQIFVRVPQGKNARVDFTVQPAGGIQDQLLTFYLDEVRIGNAALEPGKQKVTFHVQGAWIQRPVSRLTFQFKTGVLSKRAGKTPVAAAFDTLDVTYE